MLRFAGYKGKGEADVPNFIFSEVGCHQKFDLQEARRLHFSGCQFKRAR